MENPFYQKPQKSMRQPRAKIHAEIQATVRYRALSREEEIRLQTSIGDISEKGALFITPKEAIPLETEVRATFRLPGHENDMPTEIVGKTRRTKYLQDGRCETGVEFTEVSEISLRSIRSFVSRQELGETI